MREVQIAVTGRLELSRVRAANRPVQIPSGLSAACAETRVTRFFRQDPDAHYLSHGLLAACG